MPCALGMCFSGDKVADREMGLLSSSDPITEVNVWVLKHFLVDKRKENDSCVLRAKLGSSLDARTSVKYKAHFLILIPQSFLIST